jgi:hypothetical protein
MKILILDDDLDRHHSFARLFTPKHSTLHVQSVAKCVEALRETRFDVVFLDHDLADFCDENTEVGMYGSRDLTGVDVALFMAKDLPEDRRPGEIIVHSWNPAGAKRMVETLQGAGFNVRYQRFDPKTLRFEYASY